MLSFACIYDVLPIWDCLFSESIRPNTLLRSIVSRTIFGHAESLLQKETADAILDVYEAISRLDHLVDEDRCRIVAEIERAVSFATTATGAGRGENPSPDRLDVCCQITSRIFWAMLQPQSHFQQSAESTESHEIQRLLKHLSHIEPLYWIHNAPEIFTWITFTGAAASGHQDARAAFISQAGTILTAIDDENLTLLRQGWRYFRLLKKLKWTL